MMAARQWIERGVLRSRRESGLDDAARLQVDTRGRTKIDAIAGKSGLGDADIQDRAMFAVIEKAISES
ncbi:hypothetical protein [Sphingopyxis sp.]|uniref:hypothetical protein n=1 Tax=Sphingopyxis sp. TaxID=1908224 RepID=UPI0025F28629|nr:hypothetical protein [Sphingopyxis sp.]MBK6413056.1 hypothetical protein [Sphingopyxis sp.]